MATNNGSAEIVNMEDARARRRAAELDQDDFPSAGAHLRAVREASGYSLDEVSERTHIKVSYLEAIEGMALEKLPSRPFAIGFSRVYAEALGLDADDVVTRFKQDAGFSARVEIESEKFEAAQALAETDRPELSLIAFVSIVAFILWCALQITQPRQTTTPFSLNAPAQSAPTPADAASGLSALGIETPSTAAVVVEPRLVEEVEPVYPKRCEASAAPLETVEIAFNITSAGNVAAARVATSSNPCFDDAALNAARRWGFEPRTVDGAPRPAYDQRHLFSFRRPR